MNNHKSSLIIMTLAILIGHVSAAEITVIPSSTIVNQGDTFYMNIYIDPNGVAIAGAQVNIAYNNSLIKVNEVIKGDVFKQNGIETTFFNSGVINNSAGTVINIFDVVLGRKNVSTIGTFIVINMTAIGSSGISGIDLSNAMISTPAGIIIDLNTTNGSVRINTLINNPPLLAAIGDKEAFARKTLSFNISANDADGDTLTYSASNLPRGAVFNTETKKFTWRPGFTQIGTYSKVHFEVSDGYSLDFEDITINVKPYEK